MSKSDVVKTEPQMPVLWDTFGKYDTDGEKGLSATEIEEMPDNDAVDLFNHSNYWIEGMSGDHFVSLNEGLKVFNQLTDKKQAFVFNHLEKSSVINNVQGEYFKRIATLSPARAASLLIEIKEDSGVNRSAILLRSLPKHQQEQIIHEMSKKDVNYSDAITIMIQDADSTADTIRDVKDLLNRASNWFMASLIEGNAKLRDNAIPLFEKAIDVANGIRNEKSRSKVFKEIAFTLNDAGLYEKTIPLFEKLIAVAEKIQDAEVRSDTLTAIDLARANRPEDRLR